MNDLDRLRRIARIFSRPVLAGIARRGSADVVARDLLSLGVEPPKKPACVADLFDASFAVVAEAYRCEYVYKAVLANRIVFGHHSPRTASLAVELRVARSIVDVAVFNRTSTAYEIKTELDNQRRLATQTPDYLKAFDEVYVVTHPDLAARYAPALDERVGVLGLTAKNSLSVVREAVADISRVDPATVFRMLRRQEYVDAVQAHLGPQPQLPNGRIAQHHESLFAQFTGPQAHEVLVRAMRQRTQDVETTSFLASMPASLRALAYATPLSRPQRVRLKDALAAPL